MSSASCIVNFHEQASQKFMLFNNFIIQALDVAPAAPNQDLIQLQITDAYNFLYLSDKGRCYIYIGHL